MVINFTNTMRQKTKKFEIIQNTSNKLYYLNKRTEFVPSNNLFHRMNLNQQKIVKLQ